MNVLFGCIDNLCDTGLLTIDCINLVDNHIGRNVPTTPSYDPVNNSPRNHISAAAEFMFVLLVSLLQSRNEFGRFSATNSDFIFLPQQLVQVFGVLGAQTWLRSYVTIATG